MKPTVVIRRKPKRASPETQRERLASHEMNPPMRGGLPQARNHGSYTGTGSGSM